MRISDWSSDVCSSDLFVGDREAQIGPPAPIAGVGPGFGGERIGGHRERRAEFAARDVDQVGDDGARGGAIACARAFEEQPPDEIALGDDRIETVRDMRERMIERNEVRTDTLEHYGDRKSTSLKSI